MAYSDANITNVSVEREGADIDVRWDSSDPPGTVFQVYLDRRLRWNGTATAVVLPGSAGVTNVEVGAVGAGEGSIDFSADLAADLGTGPFAKLSWSAPADSPEIESFLVFRGEGPGDPPDYAAGPIDRIPAHPRGVRLDAPGSPPAAYVRSFGPLPSGDWHFGLVPVDAAGTWGAAAEIAVTIAVPPAPPTEVSLAYDFASKTPTLSWAPSAG